MVPETPKLHFPTYLAVRFSVVLQKAFEQPQSGFPFAEADRFPCQVTTLSFSSHGISHLSSKIPWGTWAVLPTHKCTFNSQCHRWDACFSQKPIFPRRIGRSWLLIWIWSPSVVWLPWNPWWNSQPDSWRERWLRRWVGWPTYWKNWAPTLWWTNIAMENGHL